MYFENANLRLVNTIANHLVDATLHIGVVQELRLNHNCLCIVIVNTVDVLIV